VLQCEFSPPNSPLRFLKVVIPGARCDRLWVALLGFKYEFGHVITHVGANYIPTVNRKYNSVFPPCDVVTEICDFLDALAELFRCHVSFSIILPQVDQQFIEKINYMNYHITKHCQSRWYGVLRCASFARRNGLVDDSLFSKADGIHLGPKGIELMQREMMDHVLHCDRQYYVY
jgi:hypothetical protein